MEIIFGIQNKLQSYDPYLFYFYSFREACIHADLIVVCGYGFMDTHINDNLISSIKLDPSKKLLVNVLFDETKISKDEFISDLSRKLELPKDNIEVINAKAIDFFTSNLNIDYFSSIFPDELEESELLPQ